MPRRPLDTQTTGLEQHRPPSLNLLTLLHPCFSLFTCGEVEDVVGALTQVVGGVAQVFHDLLVELRLLLVAEVEEGEEEDRQEEVESGEDQREERTLTWMAMMME